MDKIKRITPEQYRTLAALQMPVYSYPLNEDGETSELLKQYVYQRLKSPGAQREELENYECFIREEHQSKWGYWTLVQADEEQQCEEAS